MARHGVSHGRCRDNAAGNGGLAVKDGLTQTFNAMRLRMGGFIMMSEFMGKGGGLSPQEQSRQQPGCRAMADWAHLAPR